MDPFSIAMLVYGSVTPFIGGWNFLQWNPFIRRPFMGVAGHFMGNKSFSQIQLDVLGFRCITHGNRNSKYSQMRHATQSNPLICEHWEFGKRNKHNGDVSWIWTPWYKTRSHNKNELRGFGSRYRIIAIHLVKLRSRCHSHETTTMVMSKNRLRQLPTQTNISP